MIQVLSPGDLANLLLAGPRALPNQARSKSLAGNEGGPVSLLKLLQQWLPVKEERYSFTWRDDHLKGLVSARSLPSPNIWDIDCLAITPEEDQAATALLEGLSSAGIANQATKIFLRLDGDSPLMEAALRASFARYNMECFYSIRGKSFQLSPPEAGYSLQPEAATDEQQVFTLYSSIVPPVVRQAEGLTLKEWQEIHPQGLAGRGFVCLKEGGLAGWFRIHARHRSFHFELLIHPKETGAGLQYMLSQITAQVPQGSSLGCWVPEFHGELGRALSLLGFTPGGEHACLVRRLAVPVTYSQLVPARA